MLLFNILFFLSNFFGANLYSSQEPPSRKTCYQGQDFIPGTCPGLFERLFRAATRPTSEASASFVPKVLVRIPKPDNLSYEQFKKEIFDAVESTKNQSGQDVDNMGFIGGREFVCSVTDDAFNQIRSCLDRSFQVTRIALSPAPVVAAAVASAHVPGDLLAATRSDNVRGLSKKEPLTDPSFKDYVITRPGNMSDELFQNKLNEILQMTAKATGQRITNIGPAENRGVQFRATQGFFDTFNFEWQRFCQTGVKVSLDSKPSDEWVKSFHAQYKDSMSKKYTNIHKVFIPGYLLILSRFIPEKHDDQIKKLQLMQAFNSFYNKVLMPIIERFDKKMTEYAKRGEALEDYKMLEDYFFQAVVKTIQENSIAFEFAPNGALDISIEVSRRLSLIIHENIVRVINSNYTSFFPQDLSNSPKTMSKRRTTGQVEKAIEEQRAKNEALARQREALEQKRKDRELTAAAAKQEKEKEDQRKLFFERETENRLEIKEELQKAIQKARQIWLNQLKRWQDEKKEMLRLEMVCQLGTMETTIELLVNQLLKENETSKEETLKQAQQKLKQEWMIAQQEAERKQIEEESQRALNENIRKSTIQSTLALQKRVQAQPTSGAAAAVGVAQSAEEKLVQELIDNNRLNAPYCRGNAYNKGVPYTPLQIAILNRNVQLVKLLLEAGADSTIKDTRGNTAIELAQDVMKYYRSENARNIVTILFNHSTKE